MILILNTSILISSLIKDSVTRQILLLPSMKFYLPEYALEEIEAHKMKISRLSRLSTDEIDILFVAGDISIIPSQTIQPYLSEAEVIFEGDEGRPLNYEILPPHPNPPPILPAGRGEGNEEIPRKGEGGG